MQVNPHLPNPAVLRCLQITIASEVIDLQVECTSPLAACPLCGRPSSRVHSRYARTLADLPWHGTTVRLILQIRRFRCDTTGCPRQIFAERLPEVADRHARKTTRLTDALRSIGFALGGEPGSRLAQRLGMPTSGDTLLRAVRRTPSSSMPNPHVLGVDDWAWRRGRSYGTILCDLEQHRPVDLLPERSAEVLIAWLRQHPGAEIVTRDRASCYSQGIAAGAPQAIQVADRWHLLHNLRDALKRLADRHHREVQEAARAAATSQHGPPEPPSEERAEPADKPMTKAQECHLERRARRQERYERVIELHRRSVSQRVIGKQLGLNRETVRRYIRAEAFPERAGRIYTTLADPFTDYLRQRWNQGCHNAAQIARELKERDFTGSYYVIRRRLARWREAGSEGSTGNSALPTDQSVPRQPSGRRVAGLLLRNGEDLSPEEVAFVEALLAGCPAMRTASDLAQEFTHMFRERAADRLDDWLEHSLDKGVPADLRTYANGLRSDIAAVRAALTLNWSNGQVEGQVNRLKLIKRQMYGRAGFELLRQRVLHTG